MNYVNQGNYSNGAMVAVAANSQPTPRDTIGVALDAQSNSISGLFEQINKLEAVLGPVLEPAPPKSSEETAPQPIGVREVVRTHNRSIGLAQTRIGELIDRLHI